MFPVFHNIQCLHRIGESPLRRACAVWAFVGAMGSAQAQPEENRGVWQLSAGWQDYSEPQMNLKGPELGVHWQSRTWGQYTLESEAQLGLQNYSSVPSGRLDSVLNIDTRWRALRASTAQPQWQVGLALHTHANFLRGTTSLGYGGYAGFLPKCGCLCAGMRPANSLGRSMQAGCYGGRMCPACLKSTPAYKT